MVDVATRRGLDFVHESGSGHNGIENAVAAARRVDVAVLFIGLNPRMEGEGHDRVTLGLPQEQVDLATNVSAAQVREPVDIRMSSNNAVVKNRAPCYHDNNPPRALDSKPMTVCWLGVSL